MKKRWFVVILTIGLLLCVMPLSALALSSDPITDSDGTIIGWWLGRPFHRSLFL